MVNDSVDGMRISRISKLLVDRDAITPQEARARREAHKVTLVCGADVGASYTMQVAVLTAAGLTARCFPGGVRVSLDAQLAESRLLLWPQLQLTFGQALSGLVGTAGLMVDHNGRGGRGISMVFGDATVPDRAVRVTFDGWIAATGPTATVDSVGRAGVLPAFWRPCGVTRGLRNLHVFRKDQCRSDPPPGGTISLAP